MKITVDIPLIEEETLKQFGLTQQDLVDDIEKAVKLFALVRQIQLKDTLAKELSGDSILPQSILDTFSTFEDHLSKVSQATGVEASRQFRIRHKERDRKDGVGGILTQHEMKKKTKNVSDIITNRR